MEANDMSHADLIKEIKSGKEKRNFKNYLDQYNVEEHRIFSKSDRPDKVVQKGGETKQVKVARIGLAIQQLITKRQASFLVGDPIKLMSNPQGEAEINTVSSVKRNWHDNKLDYQTRKLARIWMSETECAEYWYIHKRGDEKRLRMTIFANSLGDTLYPYFDEYGDMQAFGREYKVGKETYFDLWTKEYYKEFKNTKRGEWIESKEPQRNLMGKIPIVYYTSDKPVWHVVQHMIERLETLLSNFADCNDYFASPMVVVKGEVQGFADKGEQGKIITLQNDADAKYLTWDQAPEAIRLEIATLTEFIFSITQTPNISFEKLQGTGNVAGVALEMMFMDSKLKAKEHEEEFGEGIQRRLNLMKAGLKILNPAIDIKTHIEPEFQFYLPRNIDEEMRILQSSTGQRQILSQKTAVEMNPFVMNAETELEQIKTEEAGQFGNFFPEQ